jgi:hypothetical protein
MDVVLPVKRGETRAELTIRTVARPDKRVAEPLVQLQTQSRPPDPRPFRVRIQNVVQKTRLARRPCQMGPLKITPRTAELGLTPHTALYLRFCIL